MGDYGDVTRDAGNVITLMDTSVPAPGLGGEGHDSLGDGDKNVVFGGVDEDRITTGVGVDIALGDNGRVHFDSTNRESIQRFIETTDPTIGANDFIVTGDATDYVLAGAADDVVGAGSDVVRDVVMGRPW